MPNNRAPLPTQALDRPGTGRRLLFGRLALLVAAVCLAVTGSAVLRGRRTGVDGPRSAAGRAAPGGAAAAAAPAAASTDGDSPAAGAAAPLFAVPAERYVPLGTMRIPKIGVETPFYPGVHDDIVALGPGLWPGTPLPGAAGNAVFAGHRTTHTHPFGDLDRLGPGDVIETALASGPAVEFRVVARTVVAEARYVDFVLRQPANPQERQITLFACAPKGHRTHRIVVQATAGTPGPPGPVPAEGGDAVRPNHAG